MHKIQVKQDPKEGKRGVPGSTKGSAGKDVLAIGGSKDLRASVAADAKREPLSSRIPNAGQHKLGKSDQALSADYRGYLWPRWKGRGADRDAIAFCGGTDVSERDRATSVPTDRALMHTAGSSVHTKHLTRSRVNMKDASVPTTHKECSVP